MRITTTRGLARVGTACLPAPSTAEITTLWWKKITPTHTRTLTNPIGTEAPLGDTAMTPDTGFEAAEANTQKPSSVDNLSSHC